MDNPAKLSKVVVSIPLKGKIRCYTKAAPKSDGEIDVSIPLKGKIRCYDQSEIHMTDKEGFQFLLKVRYGATEGGGAGKRYDMVSIPLKGKIRCYNERRNESGYSG